MSDRRSSRPFFVLLVLSLVLPAAGCDDEGPTGTNQPPRFLEGTGDDPRIGLVVTSLGRSLELFQLGDPSRRRQVALGASSSVTPVSLAVRGSRVAVPLGNAASVALIDAEGGAVERFFLFPEGNATGAAFVDDETLLVANLVDDYVGRVRVGQAADEITDSVRVAPAPTAVIPDGDRAWVLSSNLGDDFLPLGDGVVSLVDPETLEILATVSTGGRNPSAAALGPDGLLYVLNTGDFVAPSSLAVIDPGTAELVEVVEGMGVGAGGLAVGPDGRAYVSGSFFGTLVWDTETGSFVRGPEDPVCAPLEDGSCRGAFDGEPDGRGGLLQSFFGSEGRAPWIFVYRGPGYELVDSIAVGSGPADVEVRTF